MAPETSLIIKFVCSDWNSTEEKVFRLWQSSNSPLRFVKRVLHSERNGGKAANICKLMRCSVFSLLQVTPSSSPYVTQFQRLRPRSGIQKKNLQRLPPASIQILGKRSTIHVSLSTQIILEEWRFRSSALLSVFRRKLWTVSLITWAFPCSDSNGLGERQGRSNVEETTFWTRHD